MEKKVLSKTPYFDVIQKGSMFGIEPNDMCVVVMPFERDERGLPKSIGVLKEYNPLRSGDYSMTLVTGRSDEEDPDILGTAIRELKEETGYNVVDPERWCFLGFLTTSKIVMQEHPCFAVDITGLDKEEKTGDGSSSENKSSFMLVSTKEALDSSDCFIPALFMKVFRYIFNVELDKPEEKKDVYKIKQRLDIRFLNIDGVNGSVVKELEDGTQCIDYTVKELTDDIKNTIPSEYEGIKITITVANGK